MINKFTIRFPDFVVDASSAFNWMSFNFFAFFDLACRAGNVDHFARLITTTLIPTGLLGIMFVVYRLLTPRNYKV